MVFEKQSIGSRMITKNKIYVLGDSFCFGGYTVDGIEHFWVKNLIDYFKDTHELINISFPSRDVQSILDNWLKLINVFTPDDILIICIPFFVRVRVPLVSKNWMVSEIDSKEIVNRFVTHHSWYFNENEQIYINDELIDKKDLDVHVNFFERMYYNNPAVELNYNELITSLYDLTKCRKYLFSWDDMNTKIPHIEYKSDLDNLLGWSTLHDLFIKTNGKDGKEGDFHWDSEFHEKMANYLIEKFKK